MSNNVSLNAQIYVALSVTGLLILLFFVYLILRRAIRLWSKSYAFGGDTKTRLITLGLASIPFPTAIPILLIAITRFLIALVREIPQVLMTNWSMYVDCSIVEPSATLDILKSRELARCFMILWIGFFRSWPEGFSRAYYHESVPSLPLTRLILFFALWALLAYLFSQHQAAGANAVRMSRGRVFLQSAYERLNAIAIYNLLFFLILGLGAYFSLAAIIAIPSLQEKTNEGEEFSPARLKAQLEGIKAQFQNTNRMDDTQNNPFAVLENYLAENPSATTSAPGKSGAASENGSGNPASTTPGPTPDVATQNSQGSDLESSSDNDAGGTTNTGSTTQPQPAFDASTIMLRLNEVKVRRQDVVNARRNLLVKGENHLQDAISLALNEYSTGIINRKGNRERAQHFLDLTNWVSLWSGYYGNRLNTCSAEVGWVDQLCQLWANNLRLQILSGREDTAPERLSYETLVNVIGQSGRRCIPTPAPDDEANNRMLPSSSAPQRLPLGSNLGAFRPLAFWLVTLESLPLALITGLVGFGLLGSACSTFVRERVQKKREGQTDFEAETKGPIVADLAGVVIRGVSAAIVVFLAVEGGLAVFASAGSEPNPYVLLLTCLVAAVFWEMVWRAVQRRFAEQLEAEAKPPWEGDKSTPEDKAGGSPQDEESPGAAVGTESASDTSDAGSDAVEDEPSAPQASDEEK